MDSKLEKRFRERAVELGNSGDPSALTELIELTRSPVANVRRLTASAIGKLAGIADANRAVSALVPMLRDAKPQVRQYAVKALKAQGVAAKCALSDLRDIAISPVEKDYNHRDAKLAVETKVELQKKIRAKDGTWVQSIGERLICEALDSQSIRYRYDERFRILDGYAIRPDFYLPEHDIYIEYWGMDTADYKIGMLKKQKLYQQQGKKLISLYPDDKPRINEILREKIENFNRKETE